MVSWDNHNGLVGGAEPYEILDNNPQNALKKRHEKAQIGGLRLSQDITESRVFKAKPWSTWADAKGTFDRWWSLHGSLYVASYDVFHERSFPTYPLVALPYPVLTCMSSTGRRKSVIRLRTARQTSSPIDNVAQSVFNMAGETGLVRIP